MAYSPRVKMRTIPTYKSHKKVQAFKIERIEPSPDQSKIVMTDHTGAYVAVVSAGYFYKHAPQVGGYYVKYKDGYESWSPAEAFEDGYAMEPVPREEKA